MGSPSFRRLRGCRRASGAARAARGGGARGPFCGADWPRLGERRDEGEVPVALSVVQPVADDEAVGDLEADIACRQVDLAPGRLGQQRADTRWGRGWGGRGAAEGREAAARM